MARVYLETSVVSYRTSRPSGDLITSGNQKATHDWWDKEFSKHDVFISALVVTEVGRGNSTEASKRLAAISGIPELAVTAEAIALAKLLVESGAIPSQAADDAFHLAIAVVHQIEFLLTWNCKHLANPLTRRRMDNVCREAGYQPTTICTPYQLMEAEDETERPDPF